MGTTFSNKISYVLVAFCRKFSTKLTGPIFHFRNSVFFSIFFVHDLYLICYFLTECFNIQYNENKNKNENWSRQFCREFSGLQDRMNFFGKCCSH